MLGVEEDRAEDFSEMVQTASVILGIILILTGCAVSVLLIHQSDLSLIIYKLKDKIRAQANVIKQLVHKLVKKEELLDNAANQITLMQDQEWSSKDIEGKKCSQNEIHTQELHVNIPRPTLGTIDNTSKSQAEKHGTKGEEGLDQSEQLASYTEIGHVENTNSLESSKMKLDSTLKTKIVPMENSPPSKYAPEMSSKFRGQTKITSRFKTNAWIRFLMLLQGASCASPTGLSVICNTNYKHCFAIPETPLDCHKGLVPCLAGTLENALLCPDLNRPFCPLLDTKLHDHYAMCCHAKNTGTIHAGATGSPVVYFEIITMESMPSLKASVGPSSKDQSCVVDGGSEQNKGTTGNKGDTGSGTTEKGSQGCGSNSKRTSSNFYGGSQNSVFGTGPGRDGDDEPPNRRPGNGNSGHYLDEGDSSEGKKHRKKMRCKTSPFSNDQPTHHPVESLCPSNSSRMTELVTVSPPCGDSQDVPSTSQGHLQNSSSTYPFIQHPTPTQKRRSLPPYNHNSRALECLQNVRKTPFQPESEQEERSSDDREVDQGLPLYREPSIGSILPIPGFPVRFGKNTIPPTSSPLENSRLPGKGPEQNGINDGERLPYSNMLDDQEKRRTKWWDPGKDRNGSLPHGQKTSGAVGGPMRQFAGNVAEIVVNPQPPTSNLTEVCTDPATGIMSVMDGEGNSTIPVPPTGEMILDSLCSHIAGSTSPNLATFEEDTIAPQPPIADIIDERSFDGCNGSEAEPRAIPQPPTGNISENILSQVPPTSDTDTTHDSSGQRTPEIQFPSSLKRKSENKYDSNLLQDRHIRRLQPHLGRTFNGSGHSQLHLNNSSRTDRVFSHPPGDYGLAFCWPVRERLIRLIQPRLNRAFNGSVHTSNESAESFLEQFERYSTRNDSSRIDRVFSPGVHATRNDSDRVNRVFSHPPGDYGLAFCFVEERCISPLQPHLARAFDGSEHSRHLPNISTPIDRVFYHPPGNYGVSFWWPVRERLVRPIQPRLNRAFEGTPLNGHLSREFLDRPERNSPRSNSSQIDRVFSPGVHAARNDSNRVNRVFYHPPGDYGLAFWTIPRDDQFFVHLLFLIIFLARHQHHFGS